MKLLTHKNSSSHVSFPRRRESRSSFTLIELLAPKGPLRGSPRSSFTLIELLVVLALVAILSVVVVMTLNPAELIKQARDSNRLSDLSTINTALNLFSADVTSGFMGTSTVVYVSIPDNASSTCGSLGLPTLPSGYTYNCVTTQNLRNTDGSGWIPVNFQSISSNSPISQIPIDPINTTTTGNYYTYITGGSWQLSVRVESQKYALEASKTNQSDPSLYVGGNFSSSNVFVGGLVGFWDFEEGSGSATSTDKSGLGRDGTWNGTGAHYTASAKAGVSAGIFGGAANSDYISFSSSYVANLPTVSLGGWLNSTSSGIMMSEHGGPANFILQFGRSTAGKFDSYFSTKTTSPSWQANVSGAINDGNWHHIMVVYDGSRERVYTDGNETFSVAGTGSVSANNYSLKIGAGYSSGVPVTFFTGKLDNIRIYSRALSAAEVLAIYDVGK